MLYFSSLLTFRLALNCVHSPAACQVEPLVSSPFSSSTTSVHPSSVRWYAREQPAMPPPMMTTRARSGIGCSGGLGVAAKAATRQPEFQLGRCPRVLDHLLAIHPRTLQGDAESHAIEQG